MTTVDRCYQNRRRRRSRTLPRIRTRWSAPLSRHVWHCDLSRQPSQSRSSRCSFKHRPRCCSYASRPRTEHPSNIWSRHAQFPGRFALGDGIQWVGWSPGVSEVDTRSHAYHYRLADVGDGPNHCVDGTVARIHRALVCRCEGYRCRVG